jgi:hypothetical protein
MEKITLTTQLVNAVMGYLGTRPYQEVFQLIEGLQNEAKSQVQTSVEEPKAAE